MTTWNTQPSTSQSLVPTTIQSEYVISEFGAVSGATNVKSIVQDLVSRATDNGGGRITFPRGSWNFTAGIDEDTIGNNIEFLGLPGSVINKNFDGNLFPLTSGPLRTKFTSLYIDANGDTYTGSIILFGTGCQVQRVTDLYVVDGADAIFTFEPDGGSASIIRDTTCLIHSSKVDNGAVCKNTGPDTQASPRYWISSFGLSNTWWYRGTGLQSFYATDIYSRGFHFTGATSGGCRLTGCRMALFPQASSTLSLRGENMLVTDCHFGGAFTIASDFNNSKFKNNIMDTAYTLTNNAPLTSLIESPRTPFWQLGIKTIDTAQLPAASADMNNALVFENAAVGDRNAILYANSQRFRVDGGSAI